MLTFTRVVVLVDQALLLTARIKGPVLLYLALVLRQLSQY